MYEIKICQLLSLTTQSGLLVERIGAQLQPPQLGQRKLGPIDSTPGIAVFRDVDGKL